MTETRLTEQQRQTLCLLTLPNKQMGVVLGLSVGGIKKRLTKLYRDLLGADPNRCKGARIKALTKALEMGMIEMDDIVDGKWPMTSRGG